MRASLAFIRVFSALQPPFDRYCYLRLVRLEQEGDACQPARPKKTKRRRRRIVIGSGDRYLTLSALHNFCGVERGPSESFRRERGGQFRVSQRRGEGGMECNDDEPIMNGARSSDFENCLCLLMR